MQQFRTCSRRDWLTTMLFGGGMLGLRAALSGIPAWVLANPTAALAKMIERDTGSVTDAAQYLIMSCSDNGEPINCNVPGMYGDPNLRHPNAATMAPTAFSLGSNTVTAAAVWSTLSTAALTRTSFFHHGTYSFAHGDLSKVLNLQGALANNVMVLSALADLLQAPLNTIQAQPINLSAGVAGSGMLVYRGAQQPQLNATGVRDLLTVPPAQAALQNAQALRDRDVDALYQLLKTDGTTAQRTLLDKWSNSQAQARMLSQTALAQLNGITDNSLASQVKAAAILCALKLSPVIMINIPFGGDNHTDNDTHQGTGSLPQEEGEHVSGVATINALLSELAALQIQDNVTFATLSTFGRTNALSTYAGRTHNGLHTCSLMIGKNVKAGVVGGATLSGNNVLQATGIDAASGASATNGNIPYEKSLAAYGATLARAVGVSTDAVAQLIPTGTVVQGALA